VSPQVSDISARLEEWCRYDKNPNRSLIHYPEFREIREYLYGSAEYRFCKLSQYIDICLWICDDDLLASLDEKTLQNEESSGSTTGVGVSN
jgi:hypothetical protein